MSVIDEHHPTVILSADEAAKILNVTPQTVRKQAAGGALRARKHGRQWVVVMRHDAAVAHLLSTVAKTVAEWVEHNGAAGDDVGAVHVATRIVEGIGDALGEDGMLKDAAVGVARSVLAGAADYA